MPTSKRRITITITEQFERVLDTVWSAYPILRDNPIETINFVMTLKASEILTGQPAISKPQQTEQPDETIEDSDENEWTDSD